MKVLSFNVYCLLLKSLLEMIQNCVDTVFVIDGIDVYKLQFLFCFAFQRCVQGESCFRVCHEMLSM